MVKFDGIIEDKYYHLMIDNCMDEPVLLQKADLRKPFVYDREYGVFEVQSGFHVMAMCIILAWRRGLDSHLELCIDGIKDHDWDAYSEYYLEHYDGSCYKSSMGKIVYAWSKNTMNETETDYLYPLEYIGT